MAVVYGFLGLRVKENGYFFCPCLPDKWNGIRLNLCFKGSRIEVFTDKEKCRFTLKKGDPVDLYVYDEKYCLTDKIEMEIRE